MNKLEQQLQLIKPKLLKAIQHLNYSYNKVLKLPTDVEKLDDETLETWESFTARFSRVADMFITNYLRTRVLMEDLGFRGSLRDFMDQAEKIGIIDNVDAWMELRALRNINAHEYRDEDLQGYLEHLRDICPKLLELKELINDDN